MIDPDILDSLDSESRGAVEQSFRTLAAFRIFAQQSEAEFRRLAEDSSKEDKALVTALQKWRERNRIFLGLQEFGDQLYIKGESR